jgi:hypothetical protein
MKHNKEEHQGAFTLKNIDPALWRLVKSKAALAGMTLNDYILKVFRKVVVK